MCRLPALSTGSVGSPLAKHQRCDGSSACATLSFKESTRAPRSRASWSGSTWRALTQRVATVASGCSRALVVFDDVWDPTLGRQLAEPLGPCGLLVTTRVHHLLPPPAMHVHCGLLARRCTAAAHAVRQHPRSARRRCLLLRSDRTSAAGYHPSPSPARWCRNGRMTGRRCSCRCCAE